MGELLVIPSNPFYILVVMVFFQRLPIYDFKTLLLEDNFNVPKLKIRGFYEKGGSEVSLVEIRYSSNIRRTVLTFLSV